MCILKPYSLQKKPAKKVHWSENLEKVRYFECIVGERGQIQYFKFKILNLIFNMTLYLINIQLFLCYLVKPQTLLKFKNDIVLN